MSRGVQQLGRQHERVDMKAVGRRVPRSVRGAAPLREQFGRPDATAQCGRVVPVGREDVVAAPQGTDAADLRRLLAAA